MIVEPCTATSPKLWSMLLMSVGSASHDRFSADQKAELIPRSNHNYIPDYFHLQSTISGTYVSVRVASSRQSYLASIINTEQLDEKL
jgi:hypothetical protein